MQYKLTNGNATVYVETYICLGWVVWSKVKGLLKYREMFSFHLHIFKKKLFTNWHVTLKY